ncbi:drug resistance protein, partial [Pleomassaria siparia CBS 279.74]
MASFAEKDDSKDMADQQTQRPLSAKKSDLVDFEYMEEEEGVAAAAAAAAASQRGDLPFSKARCIALVLTLAGAAFLNTLGVQAAVIILPTIGRALDIPASRQQWIVSAYNLTFGCFLLLWGRLADVYGKRLIFLWGGVWVSVTSVILPFVPSEIGFDIFRGLQGLGAAAMVPTAIGILGVTFKPGKAKNYAFSCYSAGAPLGAIFGNLFGGVIGEYLVWRWVFWIYSILAVVCTLIGYLVIPLPPLQAEPVNSRNQVDWIGGSLITISLVVLLFALSEGNVVGWSTPWVPTLIVVSILLIAAFVLWQIHLEKKTDRPPLMKMSIFKSTQFSAANVVMLLFFSSFNNFLIYATYWFQDYQGLSVIQTTVRFIPTGLCGVFICFIAAIMVSRIRGHYILIFGTISVSLSSLLFALPLPPTTPYWAYAFPAMVLSVCGADTLYPTLTLFVAKSLPHEDQSLGGALINTVGQLGRAIGLAIAAAVQTAVVARELGVDVNVVGGEDHVFLPHDPVLKTGLRSTSYFNSSLGIAAFLVAVVFFRGAGKVGE